MKASTAAIVAVLGTVFALALSVQAEEGFRSSRFGGGLSRRELEGRDRAARSSSSSESDGDGRSTSQALSTGGESRASSSVRVERVEVARSAISQAFSRAENDIRRGEPVQAVAESTAIAIGEAITAVVVETEAAASVEGEGFASSEAEGRDSAVADVLVDAVAEAFAEVGGGFNSADAQALSRATLRAVSIASAESRSRAVAGPDGAALAQNRSIAVAAARPLAVAIARAFASVFGIPLSRAETDSIAVNLDQERFSDSVSNTQTRGPAAADASGEAQADSFLVDENSGLPRLSNGFEDQRLSEESPLLRSLGEEQFRRFDNRGDILGGDFFRPESRGRIADPLELIGAGQPVLIGPRGSFNGANPAGDLFRSDKFRG